jgi:hypothetical protein
MRIVALVFGLLGALGSVFLLAVGPDSEYAKPRPAVYVILTREGQTAAWESQRNTAEALNSVFYALCGSLPLGVAACILVWFRWKYIAAATFAVAFAVPFALYPHWDFVRFTLGYGAAAAVLVVPMLIDVLVVPPSAVAAKPSDARAVPRSAPDKQQHQNSPYPKFPTS